MALATATPTGIETRPQDRLDSRSIFLESQTFLIDNFDLLSQGYGVVAQIKDESMQMIRTLAFDSTSSENEFAWQYTEADNNCRIIAQFSVSPNTCSGWIARYDAAGVVSDIADFGQESIRQLWPVITDLLSSDEAQRQIAETRAKKEEFGERLAQFVFDGIITTFRPLEEVHDKSKILKIHKDPETGHETAIVYRKLAPETKNKEIDKRQERLNQLGFVALPLSSRPVVTH